MARPTESLETQCNCYAVWHSVGGTEGCIVSIRKRLDTKTIQILQYLSWGWEDELIKEYLYVSRGTLRYYIDKAKPIFGTKNRIETVAAALRLGIIH